MKLTDQQKELLCWAAAPANYHWGIIPPKGEKNKTLNQLENLGLVERVAGKGRKRWKTTEEGLWIVTCMINDERERVWE